MHGHANANRAMHDVDLILLCGARVGDRAVSDRQQVSESTKIIHIDIDPAEIGKNMDVDIRSWRHPPRARALAAEAEDTAPQTGFAA